MSRACDIKLEQFTHSVEVETERGDIRSRREPLLAAIEARLARKSNCRCRRILQLDATAEKGDAVNDFDPRS